MKDFWPTFPLFIAQDICQTTSYQGPHGILTNYVQLIRSLLWDLRGRWKQTFQKIAVLKMTKDRFSSYHRLWQTSGINLWGSTKFLASNLEYIGAFLGSKSLLIVETFEKMLSFQGWKNFGLLFLLLSHRTYVRQQFIRVHMVFWQFLCNWLDHFFVI